MKRNNLVVQSNRLIEAKHELTLEEQRLVLFMVSLISPEDEDFKPYQIKINDLVGLLGIRGQGSLYQDIKNATERLIKRLLVINEPTGALHVSWISSAKYHDRKEAIDLRFDPLLKPYLIMLRREFTSYQLRTILRFRSAYSIRIYQLLKQYEGIGEREISLKQLRDNMTGGKYALYSDFKRNVLNIAKREINEHSDIEIDFIEKKKGRRVERILFTITHKQMVEEEIENERRFPSKDPFSKGPDHDAYTKRVNKELEEMKKKLGNRTL